MSDTQSEAALVFDPGLCRCCGREMNICLRLNVEYDRSGKKEVYADMIMDCYGFRLNLDSKLTYRLICVTCVGRLRDALAFRLQLLQMEEVFLEIRRKETIKTGLEPSLGNQLEGAVEVVNNGPEDCVVNDDADISGLKESLGNQSDEAFEEVKSEPDEYGEDPLGCHALAGDVAEDVNKDADINDRKKRPKLTFEERRERKKLAERRRREKIRSDPALYAQSLVKSRESYQRKKEQGKIIPVSALTPRQQKIRRKKSRQASNKYNMKKKILAKLIKIEEHGQHISLFDVADGISVQKNIGTNQKRSVKKEKPPR